jgi:hypothetical protein
VVLVLVPFVLDLIIVVQKLSQHQLFKYLLESYHSCRLQVVVVVDYGEV